MRGFPERSKTLGTFPFLPDSASYCTNDCFRRWWCKHSVLARPTFTLCSVARAQLLLSFSLKRGVWELGVELSHWNDGSNSGTVAQVMAIVATIYIDVFLAVAMGNLHQLLGMKWNEISFIHSEHFIPNLHQLHFIPSDELLIISFSLVIISLNISLHHGNHFIPSWRHIHSLFHFLTATNSFIISFSLVIISLNISLHHGDHFIPSWRHINSLFHSLMAINSFIISFSLVIISLNISLCHGDYFIRSWWFIHSLFHSLTAINSFIISFSLVIISLNI